MSDLDTDYNVLLQEKLRQAKDLLNEATKLATEHNIKVSQENIDNLYDIVTSFPKENWNSSDEYYGWQSSSQDCW